MIESSSNAQIKHVTKLYKSSKYRRENNEFIIEGYKMLSEAMLAGCVKKVYVSQEQEKTFQEKYLDIELPVEVLTDSLFQKVSGVMAPQGVLAIGTIPAFSWEECMKKERIAILCLEDVNDPGNLGTMIRTAEGAGITAILCSKGTVDRWNPKVVRSTMGSLFRVPCFVCDDLKETLLNMKQQEIRFYAAHLAGNENCFHTAVCDKMGILIGNEANGLSEEITALADYKVKIPMEGKLESLNAAVSAAILMYELVVAPTYH